VDSDNDNEDDDESEYNAVDIIIDDNNNTLDTSQQKLSKCQGLIRFRGILKFNGNMKSLQHAAVELVKRKYNNSNHSKIEINLWKLFQKSGGIFF
jgi:hypothetical protein